MRIWKPSLPTVAQFTHGSERVLAVFTVGFFGFLQLNSGNFDKSTLHAAILAGITAIYQLIVSTLTTK